MAKKTSDLTDTAQAAPDVDGLRDVTSDSAPPAITVDPALADLPVTGANKHYADRPQLDPVAAARPDVGQDAATVARAERETQERLDAQREREQQEAEANQAHADALAKRNADAPLIKTRSEFAALSLTEQQAFAARNGTVTEDPVSS